jgi:hypothetical protein
MAPIPRLDFGNGNEIGAGATDFFITERQAEDVHADVGGDARQLGHISGKKAPPLDILEEAFETAGR